MPALGQFLGSAKGLSASTITKLTETWTQEARAFGERDLSGFSIAAQHARCGTGADGVLTAATPTPPMSTSVTSQPSSKIASLAVLLFVVIDIPHTPVGPISIVKKVGK